MRNVSLICREGNSNKFYNITELANGDIEAKYGRIGSTNPQSKIYEKGDKTIDELIHEKKRKGYQLITDVENKNEKTNEVPDRYDIWGVVLVILKGLEACLSFVAPELISGKNLDGMGYLNNLASDCFTDPDYIVSGILKLDYTDLDRPPAIILISEKDGIINYFGWNGEQHMKVLTLDIKEFYDANNPLNPIKTQDVISVIKLLSAYKTTNTDLRNMYFKCSQ